MRHIHPPNAVPAPALRDASRRPPHFRDIPILAVSRREATSTCGATINLQMGFAQKLGCPPTPPEEIQHAQVNSLFGCTAVGNS